MAEMGVTPTDRWHLLGKHGCHYVDSAEFVETREFDELALTHPECGSIGVPSDVGGPDSRWCRHCEDTIDDMRDSRYNTVVDLKGLVPYRDISWQTVDCEGDCPWCGKADSATQYDDDLDETELTTERAEEVFTSFEVPGESDTMVRTVHEVGHPARTVVDHAARDDVDHVVVGSHGREGVSRLLLGSVAEKIVRRSPVPVTVVR